MRRGAPVGPSAGRAVVRARPIEVVANALTLAASRRLIRPADAMPLATIRSLADYSPVIEEVLEVQVSPEYFGYPRTRIAQHLARS
jgi:hypothetical protein